MTTPERQLIETQTALTTETCRCGAVPLLGYDPGCMWIECGRCGLQAVVPEFDAAGVLEAWRKITN